MERIRPAEMPTGDSVDARRLSRLSRQEKVCCRLETISASTSISQIFSNSAEHPPCHRHRQLMGKLRPPAEPWPTVRTGLAGGGRWIRTLGPTCGGWRLGLLPRSYGKCRGGQLRFAPDSPLEGEWI